MNINVDPARVAYSVMAGVGFLGAGTIWHRQAKVIAAAERYVDERRHSARVWQPRDL